MGERTTPLSVPFVARNALRIAGCLLAAGAAVALNAVAGLPGPMLRTSFLLLCLVLLTAAVWGLRWAIFLSLASVAGFSWILPPVGRLKFTDWREAYALAAFLIVAFIGSSLSRRMRREAARAIESEQELRDVMNAAPAQLWRCSPDGAVELVNAGWHRYTGLPAEEAFGWRWEDAVHPDDRALFAAEWKQSLTEVRSMEREVRVRNAGGHYRWWFVRNVPRKDSHGNIVKWYGGGFDIEDRKRAELFLSRENQILEMVAKGDPLPEILRALCLLAEEFAPGSLAAVLLLEGDRLRHAAAPGLPKPYTDALENAAPGLAAGSCGTAAYWREPFVVEDVATDPSWKDFRELTALHSLRSCWSTPVFSSRGEVIASLAMYHRDPHRPDRAEQPMIRQIAQLAAIAVERKLIQEALGSSEAYLTEAQRVAHMGTWVWKIDGRQAIYVSDEWYRIYGFDPALGPPNLQQRLERIHPEDRHLYVSAVERAIAGKTDYEVEFRIALPGGEIRYLHVNGHPVADESGNLVTFVGIAGDITERKLAEMALRAAMEERTRLSAFREEIGVALSRQGDLRAILHSCAEAVVRHLDAAFARIWTLSSDARTLELQASAGMYTHLDGFHSRIPIGYLKIGLIAQTRQPHFTNDAQSDPRVSDLDWARREGMIAFAGYPLVLEDRIVGVIAMFSRKPLTENTLEALSFAAGIIAQGIERKRAEEALRRSEAYLAEGQRLTHMGSWGLNVATQQALHSSAEHTRLFGLDPNAALPSFEEFLHRVHPQDQQHVLETFQSLLGSGQDLDLRFRVALPDGTLRYLHAIGHPLLSPSGVSDEYVGITIDITERMRSDQERERLHHLEADLAHMNRVSTMGELTASLAHEVNQPITAAMTNARTCMRWLARDTPNIERAREAAARIVDVTDRAARIISRIRMQFRKGTPERQWIDLNEVILDIIALLGNEAGRYGVSISTELASALPPVLCDRIQLQQVLMNLAINGIEAMKNGENIRTLTFRSQQDANDRVLISVTDTGPGLPPGAAEEVFSPFFTTKPEGTGMGLAISRSIVESHGGSLWATSNPDAGASFYFALPPASYPA
ncbi:MAG: PAS domain-containing protein [Acidobacteriota bacterium]